MTGKRNDYCVSVRELAALLQVSTDTIRRAYRRGEVPAIRVKTALRFDLEEVKRCMERRGQGTETRGFRRGAPAAIGGGATARCPRLVIRGRLSRTKITKP